MFSVIAHGMIITMSEYGGSQIQVQRLRTLKNLNKSKLAAFLSIPMLVSFHLLCCLSGLIIYAYFRFCDPITSPDSPIEAADQLLPYFITTTFSDIPGLPGLCICGIFSATLSTISSTTNSLTSVASEDFLKPIFPRLSITVFHNKIISGGEYYECWEKLAVSFRPLKRAGRLCCELLAIRLVTKNHGVLSGAVIRHQNFVKLGKTGKKTHGMIKETFGDVAMGRSGVFECHKLFLEGREGVGDDDHSGRPLTSKTSQNVSRVKHLLNSGRRMSIRIIADERNVLFVSAQPLLTIGGCTTTTHRAS
ncbi:protein GVQW3 [Trichonephila clavipes]|nr:protein GVQW3 [Trichonephila clavipes]